MILKEFIYKDSEGLDDNKLDISICRILLPYAYMDNWDIDYEYKILYSKINKDYTLYLIEVTGSYLCE
jgi:hypothetical protein